MYCILAFLFKLEQKAESILEALDLNIYLHYLQFFSIKVQIVASTNSPPDGLVGQRGMAEESYQYALEHSSLSHLSIVHLKKTWVVFKTTVV